MKNQSRIKIGDQVLYNGLGSNRVGNVISRTQRTITIKFMFSTLKLSFKQHVSIEDLGIKVIGDETP